MGGDNSNGQHPLGWNAHRHQSSPIGQPRYRFQDVIKCQKSLEGSDIQEITNTREAFKEIMAEMVLLCTEAVKRSHSGRTAGKPLSLEYIADRLDVDDPCSGYIIRSTEGHLQGFITVTTFTNWQKDFRWDSLHEVSFYYDAHDDGDAAEGDGDTGGDDEDRSSDEIQSSSSGDSSYKSSSIDNGTTGNNNNKKAQHPRTPGPNDPPPPKAFNNKNTQQKSRKRIIDEDGSLAKELQKTVRLGDPYNEGIVWPRIAEISLLGALGCGRSLVQLAIEQLEFQRASGSANYDYLALQATDNSIPFYESIGFVRVGAVIYDTKGNGDSDGDSQPSSPTFSMTSPTVATAETTGLEVIQKNTEAIALSAKSMVASPNFMHEVARPGETPNDIAKFFKVCVWDIIFLNKDIYPGLRPSGKLMKGTLLHVPEISEEKEAGNIESNRGDAHDQNSGSSTSESPTKWFVAKENDTPRKIAKQFNIACKNLVSANRRRLPELQATSRLKAGTRVKVSNLDQLDKICQPYCHWSFPEDTVVEGGDPSYMMVYKLDRKTARNPRTVRESFAVPVGRYSPPRLLFPPPPKNALISNNEASAVATTTPGGHHQMKPSRQMSPTRSRKTKVETDNAGLNFPKEPKRPTELKKPPPESGKDIYWDHQKELHPEFTRSTQENERTIRERWSRLGGYKKDRYHGVAAEARKIYSVIEREHKAELSTWKKACQEITEEHELKRKQNEVLACKDNDKNSLFSKVIKLRGDALEGKDYKYWFVLTYIPDLRWCHLAPMVQEGHFGPERKRSHGRPRYRLVDENLGKELDISSMYCIPLKSKALKRTVDADKEEWDIIDGPVKLVIEDVVTDTTSTLIGTGVGLTKKLSAKGAKSKSNGSCAIGSTRKRLSKQPKFRGRSPIKPMIGKMEHHSQDPLKRTRSSPSASGRKRSIEKISLEDKVAFTKVLTNSTPRKRRRCMRCIDNGAILSQAIECQGAKGRFGRDACEFFINDGVKSPTGVKKNEEEATKNTEIIQTVDTSGLDTSNPKIEVTLASPLIKPRRPDPATRWMSPAMSNSSKLKTSTNEKKDDIDYTPRKSRRLSGQ